jgi:hypothetical protein
LRSGRQGILDSALVQVDGPCGHELTLNTEYAMQRGFASLVALTTVLTAIGCSDQRPPAPAELKLSASRTPSFTCSFNSMNSFVAQYFNGTADKQVVTSLINAMQTAFGNHDTTATRDRGFDVMSHIASQVKAGNSDFQDASSLTNALLACMLFTAGELPQPFPEDFSIATNPALDGGYDVRGEPPTDPDADPGQRVYARPTSFGSNGFPTHTGFSGMAPDTNANATTYLSWSQIIQTVRAPHRVLLYGKPGSNSLSYDWRAVPRNVSYVATGPGGGPGALVGLCVVGSSKLVHETGTFTGFNPFQDAYFMDPAICQSFAFDNSGWNPLRLLGKVFSPRPVWGNPGGTGGLIGGHSQFDGDETQMTATFSEQPPATVQVCSPVAGQPNAGCPTSALFEVAVATTGTGTRSDGTVDQSPVGPATVHLTAVTNNGTFGQLCQLTGTTTFNCEPIGDTLGTTITQSSGGPPGFSPATFANLFFTKTGAERLVANGNIPQRSITTQATSNKLNVKP